MTLQEELFENGWKAYWTEEDEPRQFLRKVFEFDGIGVAARATKTITALPQKYNRENDIDVTINSEGIAVLINTYQPGPLDDTFYKLASAIQQELGNT